MCVCTTYHLLDKERESSDFMKGIINRMNHSPPTMEGKRERSMDKEVILKGIDKSSSKEIVARERERENVLCSKSHQWRRRQG